MTDISLRYLLFGEDKSATSTVSKVGGAFSKLGSQIGGEFGEILNRVGEGIDHMGEHAKTAGAKLTGVGAIIGGVGVAFQLAGSKEAQGAAQLNAAIDATGQAHEDYAKGIEEAIKSNERFGFGAADTQQALAKLTAATNDPKKAIEEMGLTANLAASQHISLQDASKMLARVLSGTGGRVLAQYGIQMDKTKSKTEAGRIASEELAKKLNGQASAAVDSFGGKIRVWQTRIGDATASIGQKLGPALTVLGPAMMGIGTIIETGILPKMGAWIASTAVSSASMVKNAAIATVSAIRYGIVAAATGVWTAAQWALNAALDANPISLIIIGIAALIAVIILAWKHSETFRRIVTTAFHVVLGAVSDAWHWISGHWPLLLAILTGPIGLAVLWIKNHWAGISAMFKAAAGVFGNLLSGVTRAITAPFQAAFKIIMDGFHAVQSVAGAISNLIGGGGGPKHPASLRVPGRASGGSVRKGFPYIVGENKPELFIPTENGYIRPSVPAGGGSGGMNLEINFYGPVDKAAVGKQVVETIVEYQRQQRRAIPMLTTQTIP